MDNLVTMSVHRCGHNSDKTLKEREKRQEIGLMMIYKVRTLNSSLFKMIGRGQVLSLFMFQGEIN